MKKALLFTLFAICSLATFAQVPVITDNSLIRFEEGDDTWNNTALALKTYLSLSGGGTVTNVSSGNLSPLFTVGVTNPTTTPAFAYTLTNAGANTYLGNATGGATAPSYTTAGALSKTDDTNVTLTLGGSPTTSLLASTSLTLGWTGQLGVGRGGTGLSAIGGDFSFLGSNGAANTYFTLAFTNISAAVAASRSTNTININIPDADASFRGLVTTGTQTMAGNKTWTGTHTNTGLITGNGGIDGVATASQAALSASGVFAGAYNPTYYTANQTIDQTNNMVVVGTLTGNITLTLPACNGTREGWEYQFFKAGADAFAFIIDPNGAETFYDGSSTKSVYSQGNKVKCKCDSNTSSWLYYR